MAKHHPDLVLCRKQPGISIGRLCEKCDGTCPICASYVNPHTAVQLCHLCGQKDACIICGNKNANQQAYYCRECVQLEKDREGCPNVINLSSTRKDAFYSQKKYGFKKR